MMSLPRPITSFRRCRILSPTPPTPPPTHTHWIILEQIQDVLSFHLKIPQSVFMKDEESPFF